MFTPARDWLLQQGLSDEAAMMLTVGVEVALVIALAAVTDMIAKRFVVSGLEALVGRAAPIWGDIIVKRRLLHRLSHLHRPSSSMSSRPMC